MSRPEELGEGELSQLSLLLQASPFLEVEVCWLGLWFSRMSGASGECLFL